MDPQRTQLKGHAGSTSLAFQGRPSPPLAWPAAGRAPAGLEGKSGAGGLGGCWGDWGALSSLLLGGLLARGGGGLGSGWGGKPSASFCLEGKVRRKPSQVQSGANGPPNPRPTPRSRQGSPGPSPAWGQSSLGWWGHGEPETPPSPPQPPPRASVPARETRPRLLSFQRLEFLERTPSWVCYFYPPQPSGLHGDASKQQIPGGNDVTFPLPAAQAPRAPPCGTPARAPRRPRPSPPGAPDRGPGRSGLSCPLPARQRGLQRPPEPRGGGHRPRGRPSLPLRAPCHAGCPVGAAAGPSGWGGRGRPAPGLAGCPGSRLSGLGRPRGSLIRKREPWRRASEVAAVPGGPVAWSAEALGLCPWACGPLPHLAALSRPVVGHMLYTLVLIGQLNWGAVARSQGARSPPVHQ